MLVYKISEYSGGEFYYRETDESLMRELINFMDCQEEGNTMFVEVVNISREEFNSKARSSRM